MARISKTSTLNRIEDIYISAISKIIETIRFKYDVPESLYSRLKIKSDLLNTYKDIGIKSNATSRLEEEIKTIESYTPIVYEMGLIYCIAHFEAYLNDLTSCLLQYYWKTLKTKHKTLSYEEVLRFESINELKEELINKEIMRFSHLGIMEKVSYYEDKFNLEFSHVRQKGVRKNWNCIERADLVKSFATRNIILHNGGRINEKYIQLTGESETKIGDIIKIDEKQALDLMSVLFRVCDSFRQVSKEKIKKKNS